MNYVFFVEPDGTAWPVPRIEGGKGDPPPPQNTTQVTRNEPYAGQKDVLDPLLKEIMPTIYDAPREYFPGSTVVPLAPETEYGLTMQADRAMGGSPMIDMAGDELTRTLGGDYLNAGNPAFGAMADRIHGDVRQRMDSQFAEAGRYGSPAHQEASARAFADAMAPLEYGNYQAERERMMSGIDRAQSLAGQDYVDAAMLKDVGATREGLGREHLEEEIARHNFAQTGKAQQLAEAIGLAGNFNLGGTSTTTGTIPQQNRGSNFGQMAGLGLQAASLGIPAPKPTVICTEYYRRGWISDETYRKDQAFSSQLDGKILNGYLAWAIPLARKMRRHDWLACLIWPLARPVIMAMTGKGGAVGKLMLAVGLRVCRALGKEKRAYA